MNLESGWSGDSPPPPPALPPQPHPNPAIPIPPPPWQGIFGMNLESGLERFQPTALWVIAGLGLATGSVLMLAFGGYAYFKGGP